jgi:hypothetical protein
MSILHDLIGSSPGFLLVAPSSLGNQDLPWLAIFVVVGAGAITIVRTVWGPNKLQSMPTGLLQRPRQAVVAVLSLIRGG